MSRRIPKFLLALPLWQIDAAGAAIVCAAAGIWYFAGIEPLGRVQAHWNTVDAELKMQREVSHQKAGLAADQDKQLKDLRHQIENSELQLKQVAAINSRVSDLTTAATESKLQVDEIKPSKPVSKPRFTVVPIRLTGVGNYPSILTFLKRLRTDFGDTGLSGLSLGMKPDGAASGAGEVLRFELDLLWYAAPTVQPAKK